MLMSLQAEVSHGRSDQKIKMTSWLPRKGYKTVNAKNLNDSIWRKKKQMQKIVTQSTWLKPVVSLLT